MRTKTLDFLKALTLPCFLSSAQSGGLGPGGGGRGRSIRLSAAMVVKETWFCF